MGVFVVLQAVMYERKCQGGQATTTQVKPVVEPIDIGYGRRQRSLHVLA
jgi:hypothetical protein